MTSFRPPFLFFLLLLTGSLKDDATAQTPRNILSRFTAGDLSRALLAKDDWKPFPRSAQEWKKTTPGQVISATIKQAELELETPFYPLSASLMMEFVRTGNRSHFEDTSFNKRQKLITLALAESMEGKGRFTDKIADGIWSICEESFWGVPAHLYMQRAGLGLADIQDTIVELFVSETAALLAVTDNLVGPALDSLSPVLRKRIYSEVNRRMLAPLERSSGRYYFLGKGSKEAPLNNWNPWIISNWISCLLLLEENSERKVKELKHALQLLDNYINWVGDDGAVDEGPGYWFDGVGRLFDALHMLESASEGKLTVYDDLYIRSLAAYIYKTHIAGRYFIPVADASPVVNADGLLIYRVGRSIKDTVMINFGRWAQKNLIAQEPIDKDFAIPRLVWNLLNYSDCLSEEALPPAPGDAWFKTIQLMVASSKNGLYLASHGGHNGESHNHNDVGDFILYADGQPVIIDAGSSTYTAKTFSKDRYSLWYNSSAYHNLPVINEQQQSPGNRYRAEQVKYHTTEKFSELSMDISKAWPEAAGVKKWNRKLTMDKVRGIVTISDNYVMTTAPSALTQTFMTICKADISAPGKIIFTTERGTKVLLNYDPKSWNIRSESMTTEGKMQGNWGGRAMHRLLLINKKKSVSGHFTYAFRKEE